VRVRWAGVAANQARGRANWWAKVRRTDTSQGRDTSQGTDAAQATDAEDQRIIVAHDAGTA
jgi:hypothetical protein